MWSGLVIREPDGRIWLVRPKNAHGGYQHTFPKGRVEADVSLQANAIKEAWEETGIKARIVGLIGDREGDLTLTRYYLAERESGEPRPDGKESDGVALVPPNRLGAFLNRKRDKELVPQLEDAKADFGSFWASARAVTARLLNITE
jgi:ADP-ribose pyrophosphatase YjhB (NUDIX family)